MYLPKNFGEKDLHVLRTFIRENPLGIFTTAIDSPPHPFIQTSHIPWILDITDDASETELGVLRGHMARANPQSKAMMDTLDRLGTSGPGKLEQDVLVLFNSPLHHYVTPKFYKETKPTTAKVVPTWNYATIQVYGKATIYYQNDSQTASFLASQVDDLSDLGETKLMGSDKPWKVSDAPARYVEVLSKGIIGIEIKIERMDGKFKMSQDKPLGDRVGVVSGFAAMGSETTTKLSEMIKERGELADALKQGKS